ncbi:MAG: AAA family ATPase [Okeania sp. SIO3I5]|uniref:AAA family ATPase n=1 Tax=Okeania sp. SIO3I5 TaxID=2607805 RepID=UPI0013B9D5FE|nr:AAA family ATPase [Okeania sp. SIO3I5]NEQ35537.1 AAA family ATPase [Okeania sp. SIO3I5]
MVTLAGYNNFYPIHNSANSQVYRARRVDNNESVILKFLNQDYPTSEQIRRYKQEYHLTCQLKSAGIVKAYSLVEWQRSYVIVLEDFGAISLQEFLLELEKLSLEEFLFLAIAIIESLREIHTQRIIHKDINPANIVFNPQTKELKIIDFGISTQLSRENPTLKNPNVLEGTLAYISPEQTGRMNRSLDYRTDFYSLGVTFYEMLTKQLPFTTEDALELVHSHIAKKPILPSEIDSSIPWIISQIIMKLMAKNAEERYQSLWGLKTDLENCSEQLKLVGNIEVFPLATQDISERFSIPQKLYGRESEIATLLQAFERVAKSGKVELMMVAGYSGIGKSSLVQELYKPITARRGYFISGKFDQFQRNIPYSAIVAAFGGLIRQLLGETKAGLGIWREKLLKALGNNGQVIIDVIPEVELIIGKQPPVPILGANETQNRFNLVISNFIRAFGRKEHPLTLFIDDLQWVDLASLQLIERILIEEKTEYLLLLGAYRDNEVSAGHPWAISLEKLRQNNNAINQITLNALPVEEIAYLIGDTLNKTPEAVLNLAQLVKGKTGGNPFFVEQFLQALYGEKLLQFNFQSRSWQWNLAAIKARGFTDNVVELMVEKLQKLPPSVQEILFKAACLGAEFELQILQWVEKKPEQEIFQLLKIAISRNLIIPLSELDENLLIQSYKFGHDRIQQAAYTLIPEEERAIKHLEIGRTLLKEIHESEQEDKLFDIVEQLNRSLELVSDSGEREKLARLNLQAGRKAIDANAYAAAIAYFDAGMSLLDAGGWQTQYELTLSLYQEATKAAYLNTEIKRMEQLAGIIAKEAKTPLNRLELGKIQVDAYSNQERFVEALTAGLDSLASCGIEFPEEVSQADFAVALLNIKTLIGDRQPTELANLPQMQDPLIHQVLALLVQLVSVTYVGEPTLCSLIILKQIELSLDYGNAPASAFSYATYGMILCGAGEFRLAYEYGQLALTLLYQFNDRQFETAILTVVYAFINLSNAHPRESLKPLQQAFLLGLETGDFTYAGGASNNYCGCLYFRGEELSEVAREIESHNKILETIGHKHIINYNRPLLQVALNLQGRSEQPDRLVGTVMDEESLILYFEKNQNHPGLWMIYILKAMLYYIFEKFDESLVASTAAEKYSATVRGGSWFIPLRHFYSSLARLARVKHNVIESEELLVSESLIQQVRENQEKIKHWVDCAPMNYLHKFYLVEAEYYRAIGEKSRAIEFYNLAIAGAKENKYIQEEALANELTAKFYLNWNMETAARAYMIEAHYCYSLWGATAKVKHLEENYPQLFQSPTTLSSSSTILNTRTTSNSTDGAELDLATVIKSTNAISSEIVLENLLATLMDILVENAGAQRGILILPRGESLFIEAIKEAELEEVSVLQSVPLEQFEQLSEKIVRYVARTRETVVFNNAVTEGDFTEDAYIQEYQCQSIACTPLINQNQLQGIIYLENNLSAGAFTKNRMALLRTLAAQGAISLENARLYDACQRFVPEQFLSFLEKKSIIDVKLGEQVEREMTVLFSDIRGFTTISEQMTPGENFAFINEYLGYMEPQIQKYGGFIDKYIGDAIMALFPNSPDDALKGAIAMLEELKKYNLSRQQKNINPLRIGIGLHTGKLILGTVGGMGRMDGTVIGDAVNLSSRVEGLTKTYGVSLLITHQTLARLNNPLEYDLRFIEQVKAKGKAKAVGLFEVFSADVPELRAAKNATKEKFEKAVILYHQKSFVEAGRLFEECVAEGCGDRTASFYLERCQSRD